MGLRGRRTAVAELLEDEVSVAEPAPELAPDSASGPVPEPMSAFLAAALLKVALELRHPEPERPLDALLDRVLEGTPIDRAAFRAYLQRNFALVRR